MTGWLLRQVAVEGFRGINNEGDPLQIKFRPDRINSVFAQNGIGKTSIFDALTYALTGRIARLDGLPASEKADGYYLNRFHGGSKGTIALTLSPEGGGTDIVITVERDGNGTRTVTASDGSDGSALLAQLNREFVLLDAKTFQRFVDHKPLERGRSFAGLLGLGPYSTLRQSLKAASNTRAFNGHFGVSGRTAERTRASGHVDTAMRQAAEAFEALTGEIFDSAMAPDEFESKIHGALANIAIIRSHCEGKAFAEILPDECLATIKTAEGGADRDRLAELIRAESTLSDAIDQSPKPDQFRDIATLAKNRDDALSRTQGDQFLELYRLATSIVGNDAWLDKNLCPVCENRSEEPLSPRLESKVADYDAVSAAIDALKAEWKAHSWDELTKLESLALAEGQQPFVQAADTLISRGAFTESAAEAFADNLKMLADNAAAKLAALADEKTEIEQRLPPSLVTVTEKVEAARRLQTAINAHVRASNELEEIDAAIARVERVKQFLDKATSVFSDAESKAAKRRLEAVEPICREYFKDIMHQPVVPAISKPEGSEELTISLASFYNVADVSASAVLSESFRNAFSISVYLAAASLYGGAPKFVVLDDITSSFDAGHQFFLMEVIRTRFARPGAANGPQVILLSHDTLLEKYFNTQTSQGNWWHQRIEGNARTAILPQDNAVSRIRDRTIDLLNAGNTADAAPRIRQYLEFKLEEIISKCKISVPIDIAMSDDSHVCSNLLKAINSQIKLHQAANQLVMEATQVSGMDSATATIVSNYLSHWSSGQTQAFSAGALLGVMAAINSLADCFKFAPNPGDPLVYYHSLSRRS
ncbi:MAG TPA: AAA family ATPase [Novosphingobium sp.]|nr:AAA family ATPase [Novosphingobium sp.]